MVTNERAGAAVPPPIPLSDPMPMPPLKARRSIWGILLDPRTIHWMLGSGGVLLVAGLVVWLASLGVFDNPWAVAIAIGLGTTGLMAGGWGTLLKSRYRLAGRAMTLLACLVMPLNLWFYHARGLVTMEGRLWLPALACCALYAASALVLADALFVYVLMGGVAMTGLLMLADAGRIAEIASPAALLVVLGMLALHAERAFAANTNSPFSREKFGAALFRSAQVLIAGGLSVLACAQLRAWIAMAMPGSIGTIQIPEIVTVPSLQWVAIALTLCGIYACIYTRLVVQRHATYSYLAGLMILWAELQIMRVLGVVESGYVLLAIFALQASLASAIAGVRTQKPWRIHAATALACTAAWSLLVEFGASAQTHCLVLAGLGLVQLIVGRLAKRTPGLAEAARNSAHAVLGLAGVCQTLIALSGLATGDCTWNTVALLGGMAAISLVAGALSDRSGQRRWYVSLAIAQAAAGLGAMSYLSHLSFWQKAELLSVAVGVLLLVVGHVAWWREQTTGGRSELASFGLQAGALLAGLPLLIAMLGHRFAGELSQVDELALLTVGMALFVLGFSLKIRSTTILGGMLLGVHLVVLIISAGMRAQLAMGVYLATGGAALFAGGVLLSIYRDRIQMLPQQIRERQGVFKVLSWR